MHKQEGNKAYKIGHTHWWHTKTKEIRFDPCDRMMFHAFTAKPLQILYIGCITFPFGVSLVAIARKPKKGSL